LPDASERLEASLAEIAVAVLHGASIVRTHDVLPTKKFLTVLDALKNDE
jgi:dihydropteroate synthase